MEIPKIPIEIRAFEKLLLCTTKETATVSNREILQLTGQVEDVSFYQFYAGGISASLSLSDLLESLIILRL